MDIDDPFISPLLSAEEPIRALQPGGGTATTTPAPGMATGPVSCERSRLLSPSSARSRACRAAMVAGAAFALVAGSTAMASAAAAPAAQHTGPDYHRACAA